MDSPAPWRARVPSPPDIESAVARYQDALDVAEKLEMRPLVGHCRLGLGRLCARVRNTTAAQEHLRAAATIFKELAIAMPSGADQAPVLTTS